MPVPLLPVEDRSRERPELVEGRGEARFPGEAVEPHLGMQPVVDLLAVDLGGEPRHLRVVGGLQALESDRIGLLVEMVPRDRVLPARQPQLDEPGTAVLVGGPIECELVGGKVASLGEMIRELSPLGIRVPDGFAITAEGYRHFISAAGLDERIRALLGGISDVQGLVARSAEIRNLIASAELPREIAEEVLHELRQRS